MMRNKTFLLGLLCLLLGSATAFAQVSGTVLEASTGEPVIGASVLEVGTTNGIITDFDGNFTLNVSEGAQLEFSYMGFQPQTLPAKNGMVVRLSEDTYALQEVVAIGYGSQKKKEVTGSVASVKAEDFNAGVKTNPMGLLQGKVAGLNISNRQHRQYRPRGDRLDGRAQRRFGSCYIWYARNERRYPHHHQAR